MRTRRMILTTLFAVSVTLLNLLSVSATSTVKIGGACSKAGLKIQLGNAQLLCIRILNSKKLIWTKIDLKTTPTPTPTPSVAPIKTITFYESKDKSTVQLLSADQSCSNPLNASFEIQALVDSDWLPVHLINSGWSVSKDSCSDPALGARNSLGWARVYMDPGTQYRWVFSGEINMNRDSQGRGVTQPYKIPPKLQPFKAKIPISLPVPINGTITFSNVMDHIAEVPKVAWQRVQDVIASNQPIEVTNDLYIGPNVQYNNPGGIAEFKNVLRRTQKLWSGFAQSSFYSIYIYNAQDELWAEQKLTEVFRAKGYSDWAANVPIRDMRASCNPPIVPGAPINPASVCGGANSGSVGNSNDSYMIFAHNNSYVGDYSGTIGHEYSHSVQGAQWIDHPKCSDNPNCFRSGFANRGFSPCWLYEGLVQAAGGMASKNDWSDYINNLRVNWPFNQGATKVTDYTGPSLRAFLVNQSPSTCYNGGPEYGPVYSLGYSVGALTVETLIAIAGPQATMALFALGAEGEDFPTAFQNVYGISWDEGSTLLSNVLAAEYATFGPPPK